MSVPYSSLAVLSLIGFLITNSFHLESERIFKRIFSRSVLKESEISCSEKFRNLLSLGCVISGAPWCPKMASTAITKSLAVYRMRRENLACNNSFQASFTKRIISLSRISSRILRPMFVHSTSTKPLFVTTQFLPSKSSVFRGNI